MLQCRNKWQHKNGYKEPSYDRKLLLAACEPIVPRDRRPSWDTCGLPAFKKAFEEKGRMGNPRQELLAGILKGEIVEAKVIGFFHKNAMTVEDFTKVKNRLEHKELYMKWFNRKIYELAIRDTKFSSMRSILCDQQNTVMVIGKTRESLKTLMQMEKKMPGFLLMCAFLEDRILRKDELLTYTQIGSLDDMRAQLSATLNHALASLPSHIAHPVAVLSLTLDQYVKREQDMKQKEEEKKGKDQVDGEKV